MNRMHLFRAVFFAVLRKSVGYESTGATSIAFARRHLPPLPTALSIRLEQRHFEGGL